MLKRMLSFLLSVMVIVQGLCALPASAADAVNRNETAEAAFADIRNHWAEETITELTKAGVINGKDENTFDPEGQVTRAEFIKLLICGVEAYDENASVNINSFIDIYYGEWYDSYVTCGLVSGILDTADFYSNRFMPNESINRGLVAVWTVRALGISNDSDCIFSDIEDENVKKAVATANSEGIILGYEDNTFRADRFLTRAEAAVIIKRVMVKYDEIHHLRESTNSVIYEDNVIEIEVGNENRIASVNEALKQIVFTDCGDALKNLTPGQSVVINSCEQYPQGTAFRADSVSRDNDTLIVTTSSPTIDEIFNTIDIAKRITVSPQDYVNGSSDDAVQLLSASKTAGVQLLNTTVGAKTAQQNRDLVFEIDELKLMGNAMENPSASLNLIDKNVHWNESDGTKGEVTVKADLVVDALLKKISGKATIDSTKVALENEITVKLGYIQKSEYEKRWKLGKFQIPIEGPLVAKVEFDLVFSAEGEFSVAFTTSYEGEIGVIFKNSNATTINKNKFSACTLEADADGKIELGPSGTVSLAISYVFDTFDFVYVELLSGLGVSGELTDELIGAAGFSISDSGAEDSKVHLCDLCVDGDLYFFARVERGISPNMANLLQIENEDDRKEKYTELKIKFADWYYSISSNLGQKFDFGLCPNQFDYITLVKQPQDVTVHTGDTLILTAEAAIGKECVEPIEHTILYQWYQDGVEIKGENTETLVVGNVGADDAGKYLCVAYYEELGIEHMLSAISAAAEVRVEKQTASLIITPSYLSLDENEPFSLHAVMYNGKSTYYTYQWYKNGVAVPGATDSIYAVSSASHSNGGTYTCRAMNYDGSEQFQSTSAAVLISSAAFRHSLKTRISPWKFTGADGRTVTKYHRWEWCE